MTGSVSAYSFKPTDSDDKVQCHTIKGVAQVKAEGTSSSVPF